MDDTEGSKKEICLKLFLCTEEKGEYKCTLCIMTTGVSKM
jgi:hypothetical protein